jgi:prophage tail gpP-like protein
MSNRSYIVKDGDTFESIARDMYGDSAYSSYVASANTGNLVVGNTIIVPNLPTRRNEAKSVVPASDENDLSVFIEGVRVSLENFRLVKSLDAVVDGWSGVLKWNPGENPDLDKWLKPFRYPESFVYIGGEKVASGCIYEVAPSNANRREMAIGGYSFTADIVDSCIPPPKYQWWNMSLEDHANEILKPFGIKSIFEVDPGENFPTIDADPGTKVFDHLVTLASHHGFLMTSSVDGDVVFTREASGRSVASLEEGSPGVAEWGASFNGRKRFSTYRGSGYSPLASATAVVAFDMFIPRFRILSFSVDDAHSWNISYAAEWRRVKQVADAVGIILPVSGWYNSGGMLWTTNTLVTIVSETLMVPNGYTFLIKGVEYELSRNKRITYLTLVPPGVYAERGTRMVDPWE